VTALLPSILANRGLLASVWFVVLAALAGGATLVLLQPPPPPPLGEPVVVALNLPPATTEAEAQEYPESGDAALMAEAQVAAVPEDPEAERPAIGNVEAPAEAVEAGDPAESTPPAAASQAQAAPDSAPEPPKESLAELPMVPAAPVTAPLPAPAAPVEAAQTPDGPVEEPVEDHANQAELPEAGEKASGPAADSLALPTPKPEDTAEQAAAEAVVEQPPATPEEPSTAAQAAGEHETAEAGDKATAGAEQVVAIPVIPPAPEQLPYWERYRQPFNMDDKRPRIAVVLSGLGLSDSATEAAINNLPPAITLSFSPYARDLERWIALARARGHEVMLDLPMEPSTFPNEDPGPQGLLVNLSAEDNLDRLDWVLSRGSAYVGLAGSMGSRFTASRRAMKPILQDVKARGLMFLDRRTTEESVVPEIALEIGLPRAINNRSVDERQASRVAIDARLAQIERIALTEGYAVAMAEPYPVTLNRLADWATELIGRGFVIAPISALADQQKAP
jgi:uncharacterized protein